FKTRFHSVFNPTHIPPPLHLSQWETYLTLRSSSTPDPNHPPP
ncbi:hypothetical protein NPIL_419791, partial [Nephila pilipes]